MDLMTVDGYHAVIDYDDEMDQFRGEILVLSGGADFLDLVRRSFAENSKSHWTSCWRYARSKESSRAGTIRVCSIFGFRLNDIRS